MNKYGPMTLYRWYVLCDAPDCKASVEAAEATDREAREAALRRAVALGWQIHADRFIRPREDLCPTHRGPR